MCEKVCPNGAIKPVRNLDSRINSINRSGGATVKRGGRNALFANERTLDKIVVGRISQMTDPALDSERHTFDILAPFGRVLLPSELPLSSNGQELTLTGKTPPVNWIYPIIFSDMSIGALSTRAWEAVALATAYLNEKHNMPVRMCSGEGGMPSKLMKSEHLKYMILQIFSQ
jgi:glutamate synthase (NADPH/NADH) large chain